MNRRSCDVEHDVKDWPVSRTHVCVRPERHAGWHRCKCNATWKRSYRDRAMRVDRGLRRAMAIELVSSARAVGAYLPRGRVSRLLRQRAS